MYKRFSYCIVEVNGMIDKRIGKRIKEQREALGLTQEQFAEKMAVQQIKIPRLDEVLYFQGLKSSFCF
jgi:ribosome-binding protein aMBF1 (putative translation factor)